MGFINKNANIILLFLIIMSSAALVGATIFFQVNFEDINTEYNQKVKALQTISEELEQQQALLSKVEGELNVKAEREEVLGEKFTEVKGEKEQLETQKQQLEQKREQLESEIQNTEALLRDTQQQLEAQKDIVLTLEDEVDDLEADVAREKDRREDAEQERDTCITEKAACTCP